MNDAKGAGEKRRHRPEENERTKAYNSRDIVPAKSGSVACSDGTVNALDLGAVIDVLLGRANINTLLILISRVECSEPTGDVTMYAKGKF